MNEHDNALMDVLAMVPAMGWSQAALEAALPDCVWRAVFPGGVRDAVRAFADWADGEMEAKCGGLELETMRVRDRVDLLVRLRLEALAAHRAAARAEARWLALHAPDQAARQVWATADRIWRLAGDTATDFNHYTKRGLLVAVLTATSLFWFGDRSEGFEETRAFLGRRIDEVMQAGRSIGRIKELIPVDLIDSAISFMGRMRHRR